MAAMIVVTGATGKLGRLIVEQLLARMPANDLAVSVRDPDQATDLVQRGLRVRQGDFRKPESLKGAFDGADQLLLVSSNARAQGGDPVAQHRNAITAARDAGVRRIVYTSHMGASASSAFPPMHDHAETEAMLADSGVAWTALRNGFYASTVPMLVGDAIASGVVMSPADGKVAWTAHHDLAEAAAAILVSGSFEGSTPPLTASEAFDLEEIAEILGQLHGRPFSRQVITDEDQERRMAARGAPPGAIGTTLGLYRAARAGEFAAIDPTLASLLGREPIPLHEVLATPPP